MEVQRTGCDKEGTERGIKSMKLYSNVERIYNELVELGYSKTDKLRVEDLCQHDQYHYEGTSTCDDAIDILKLGPISHVYDIGSGLGGPARYLAYKTGCKVTAFELQPDLNNTAVDLTQKCGLDNLVQHRCTDFLQVNTENSTNNGDAVVSWLTFLHIPDKENLIKKCFSVLKPGGKLFMEEFYAKNAFTAAELTSLSTAVYCTDLPAAEQYSNLLAVAGFVDIQVTDLTDSWTRFVVNRHNTWTAMKDRHTRVHSKGVYDDQKEFFYAIKKLFEGGNLGGFRLVAKKSGPT